MPLKGTRFETREDIMRNATAQLNTIPKDAFHSLEAISYAET
jgi:hypothetical protein